MNFFEAVAELPTLSVVFFLVALFLAFAFEFINGFHDTANAVTTVIYTRTLPPTPAVMYSGIMNFLGVLIGGTAVAFAIVNLLPVDLLVDATSGKALAMVLALLVGGVAWNLGTWYFGLPVSSSHTLIGSILGVGIANSLISAGNLAGVRWDEVKKVALALIISPMAGFILSAVLLLIMKLIFRQRRLYVPPEGDDRPPVWVRGVLVTSCGAVSYAHGSNDGQKGMGLILLVLIGFLSGHYALDIFEPEKVDKARRAVVAVRAKLEAAGKLTPELKAHADAATAAMAGVTSFADLQPSDRRWELRQHLFQLSQAARDKSLDVKVDESDEAAKAKSKEDAKAWADAKKGLAGAIEFVPLWVVIGVAVALGVGTTVGYKRIVVTVAEKIGKQHLTYAQGAAAEVMTAVIIEVAGHLKAPVSTTHTLNSGVAGTMVANGSGVQGKTVRKILLAWVFTLPCTMLLSGGLFALGRQFVK